MLLSWIGFLLCIPYTWLFLPYGCQQYLLISSFEAWNLKELILNLSLLLSKANLAAPSSPWELLTHPGLNLRWFLSLAFSDSP